MKYLFDRFNHIRLTKGITIILVVLMLLAMLFLEVSTAIQESQTVDEGVHLAAGYSYLVKRDFRMNAEHPPLLKELAAVPLLLLGSRLRQPFDSIGWTGYDEWHFARDFLYQNTVSADTILLLGRIPTMLLGLLLGFYIFKWCRELFGRGIALLVLLCYVVAPTVIAHGRYVTTDMALAAFFYITIYYFYKFLKSGSRQSLLAASIFLGCALASKFSSLILLPILVLLYCVGSLHQGHHRQQHFWKNSLVVLAYICLVPFLIIWLAYGFRAPRPITDYDVQRMYRAQENIITNNLQDEQNAYIQKVLSYTDTRTSSGKFIKSALENVPVPAMYYLKGVVQLYGHNYGGHSAYLLGEHRKFGWWYYLPVTLLVKTPIGTLALLLTAVLMGTWWLAKTKWRKPSIFYRIPLAVYFLVLPPLAHLVFSMSGQLNLGVRHVLLVYPFMFSIIGYLWLIRVEHHRRLYRLFLSLLVAYTVVSSLLIYPYYLAYFNEITGGPANGPAFLTDSNIDWGQDLKRLEKYLVAHEIPYVCMSYFGQAKPEYYGIDFRYLPDTNNIANAQPFECMVAISVTSLYSEEGHYNWLKAYTPTAKIGYSIYLYDFRKQPVSHFDYSP